jgi:cell division protease FtsH
LDGFNPADNVFLICATNRIELLDPAFLRPGRIDKKIYVGNPDRDTREAILKIHSTGKPYDSTVSMTELNTITSGFSGAEIENLLNEAMLHALRENRREMNIKDIDINLARIRSGFQESKSVFSPLTLKRIAIHELGHGICSLLLKDHPQLESIHLNLQSPTSPGYTVFKHEEVDSSIFTKEKLLAKLTVLLSGRVAEEIYFNDSITTGASHDLEEAFKLAESMIVRYGMGDSVVYSRHSDKHRAMIDSQIEGLILSSLENSRKILTSAKELIDELIPVLLESHILKSETIEFKMFRKYKQFL